MSYFGSKDMDETEMFKDEIILVSNYFDRNAEPIRRILSLPEFITLSGDGPIGKNEFNSNYSINQFGILIIHNEKIGGWNEYYPILMRDDKSYKIFDYLHGTDFKRVDLTDDIKSLIKIYMDNYDFTCCAWETIGNSYYDYLDIIGDDKTSLLLSNIKDTPAYSEGLYSQYALRTFNPKYYHTVIKKNHDKIYNTLETQIGILTDINYQAIECKS